MREIEEAFAQEGAKQLISLADSELLLEAFRAAGLTEWVIVLATVLRRSPLLLNLFRDDRALWSVFLNSLAEESIHSPLRELERGWLRGDLVQVCGSQGGPSKRLRSSTLFFGG